MKETRPTKPVELSLVIPVFNSSNTIAPLVQKIHRVFHELHFEVVLVNDGSRDESERVCAALAECYPETVTFVHLSRNFGEHSAVLAGLNYARGAYVGVLDDDGQNPPHEMLRMYREIRAKKYDVLYGRYATKRHSLLRNLGSWFNDRMANIMLKKPRHVYLSSFKVMNRFVVKELRKYRGAFPYIDGLVFRTTTNIGQIEVEHRRRIDGKSNYTFTKLLALWLNMFLNFSILPLRLATGVGLITSVSSILMFALIFIDAMYSGSPKPGIPTVLCAIVFFGGLNLLIAGMLGEYLGRLYLDQTGTPQFVVRYAKKTQTVAKSRTSDASSETIRDIASTPSVSIPVLVSQPAELPERGDTTRELAI